MRYSAEKAQSEVERRAEYTDSGVNNIIGYIGRFLALHIHKNNLASEVRLVDKVLPQLAWLAPEFAEACSPDKFMQADASRDRTSEINFAGVSNGRA